jgi:hypothetical protein
MLPPMRQLWALMVESSVLLCLAPLSSIVALLSSILMAYSNILVVLVQLLRLQVVAFYD